MKLIQKFSLAFVLVSLVAIGLAALFVWITTAAQFSQYIVDQRQAEFVTAATEYYRTNGNWLGVDDALRSAGLLPPFAEPGTAQPDPQPFALASQDRVIIVAGGQYVVGEKVKQGTLDRGIGIEVGGVVVGTVLTTGEVPAPNAIEQKYIDSVNKSFLIAAAGGAAIALLLGLLMARSLTRPVRALTEATRALAAGKPGQPVLVRSTDELGELASSFNQMSADLTRANQSRRQMTADIAHDLRNPLTVIGGYLESIQDGKLEPTPERIAVMQNEVRHLQHLVEDLRTLSLADAGELALKVLPTSLAELLQRVAASFQHQADQQGINMNVDTEPGLRQADIDPERMEQVLDNLVSNALRFTPEGGRIDLHAYSVKNSLMIEVKDTGKGIPADALHHVFERSYRGDPSRNGDESGLGLAIARSIVELHGGRIEGFSEGPGQGSIFSILIPIK